MSEVKWSALVEKAQADAEFKASLLANPKAAIEKATGITLPDNVNFYVHEQSLENVHLVLPMQKTSTTTSTNDERAIFVEPDDTNTDERAIFVEPDDTES